MADNDIIDFYKKADTDNKPEEPLKEQVETPEPVVSEAVAVPVPESNDPFDKFLFNLAEKLKTEKKITEQQQQQFNERIVQPTTNPEDPFAKFLESFAGLVKQDENVNKEENIKEATIDFINKLKNDDFFDRDVPTVIPKVIPKVKSKSKKYLPPKFAKKVEKIEEQPVIEQSTEPETEVKQPEPSNPYLKELQTADKKKNKIEDKISGLSDIKKIIAQQVQEQLSKYPNIGFTGGGGGTNAVQYAEGGTMKGDLNVTGKYLSGGVDISTLFGSGGGAVSGIPDRLIAGSETLRLYSNGTIDFPNDTIRPPDETILTLESENPLLSSYVRVALSPYAFFAYDNEGNSITFDQVDNAIVLTSQNEHEWTFNKQGVLLGPHNYLTVNALSSLGRILSGGKDLLEIFALSGTGGGGDGPTDRLINGSYQVVLSSNGNLTLPGAIVTASNSKLDFVGFGPNTAYLTTTPDDTTALFMGADVAELRANTYASIATNTGVTTHLWKFGADSSLEFPQSSYIGPLYTANDSWFVTSPVEPGGIASADGQQYIQVNNGSDVLIGTGWPLSAHEWAFDINGNLRFPDNTTQTTAFTGNPDSSKWDSTYTTVQSNSSNWNTAYNTATVYQTNSASYATQNYVNTNFFPLSGGTITGPTIINNNLTVFGNLTATGTTTFANTIFSVTSALSVVHVGAGPALYVGNNGTGDIASFYDIDQNVEVLHVGGVNSTFPNVGVKVSNPNKTLTVAGEISATQDITTSGKFYIQNDGNSDQWNWSYNVATAYQAVSSSFATNTALNAASSILTPLTLTNTLTSQLLPTSVYQSTSGSFATIAFSDSKYLPLTGGTITGNLNVTGQILSGGINISQLLSSTGGSGGATPIKRFDYVTISSIDYSYSGSAAFGTLDTSPTWKLIRLTYANNGTVSNSASALNSWTGRLTATYV